MQAGARGLLILGTTCCPGAEGAEYPEPAAIPGLEQGLKVSRLSHHGPHDDMAVPRVCMVSPFTRPPSAHMGCARSGADSRFVAVTGRAANTLPVFSLCFANHPQPPAGKHPIRCNSNCLPVLPGDAIESWNGLSYNGP